MTASDLRSAIEETILQLPIDQCQNYVGGMQKRLARVIELDGRNIGK